MSERQEGKTYFRTGRREIAPGLGLGEERLIDRVGREVVVVFDHDGLIGLCNGLSVYCDFDHVQVSFVVLQVGV